MNRQSHRCILLIDGLPAIYDNFRKMVRTANDASRLDSDSRVGRGTRMSIMLPLRPKEA